jgi:hypothetical protein
MRVHVDFTHYFGVGVKEAPKQVVDDIELKWGMLAASGNFRLMFEAGPSTNRRH